MQREVPSSIGGSVLSTVIVSITLGVRILHWCKAGAALDRSLDLQGPLTLIHKQLHVCLSQKGTLGAAAEKRRPIMFSIC